MHFRKTPAKTIEFVPIKCKYVSLTLRTLPRLLLALLFVYSFSPQPSHGTQEASKQPFLLGIFPYLSPRETAIAYGPLKDEFTSGLKQDVLLKTAPTFKRFSQQLASERYDIAFIQPFDYVVAVGKHNYLPLARVDETLSGLFMVSESSPYTSLAHLKGRRIALPPEQAAISRVALIMLKDSDIYPGRDVEVRHVDSHVSCLHQVMIGAAATCVTAPSVVRIFQQRMQVKLRILTRTETIPHVLFVVHQRVPKSVRDELFSLLSNLHTHERGKKILKRLGFSRFNHAVDADYDVMRQLQSHEERIHTKSAVAFDPTHDLVLGVFPYLPARKLAASIAPLPAAFTQIAEQPVHLRTATTFKKFSENMKNALYDFALIQPFDYAVAKSADYEALARMSGKISARFYVLADSSYRSLLDLRTEALAMPPSQAAVSVLAHHTLRSHGLDPERDVNIDYRRSHDSCIKQLRQGNVSACVTTPLFFDLLMPEQRAGLRSIAETLPAPNIVFVAHRRLPVNMRTRVREVILSWHTTEEGRRFLESVHLAPFQRFVDDEYSALTPLIENRP